MRHFSRMALAVVIAGVAFERSATAEPRHLKTIAIVVVNEAAVREDLLKHAQRQATRIYEPLDVALKWTDSMIAEPTALRLTIKIVPYSKLGHGEDAMGLAIKGGNLAYVFYGRVSDFAEQHQLETATVLAHVIAHEMGHLLLPNRPHSSSGIMRASWHRAHQLAIMRSPRGLSFTSAEVELIRQSIDAARSRHHTR
jgi:hypothetical protein